MAACREHVVHCRLPTELISKTLRNETSSLSMG
jgi:hypothetical protein